MSLIHNVLICHDLLRHYNRKTTPRCLMKIDLKKTYDMVRWEFLEEVLRGYGFPMPFIQLIMVCVTKTTFTVKVNGAGYGYFEGKRGLRQGDLYDLMLFCKGNSQSIHRMLEVLNHFSAVSGLVANMEKSNIYLAGMDEASKQAIVSATGFSVGTLPMRYLGLPLTSKKWGKVECHQLVEKITTNIQAGYAKLLSYAGRLQVINSVLFAMYNFWGAVFILPQSVIKAIDRKCREYLWGTTEGHRKMALISWEVLCRPKKYGGMNIKGCKNWNIASVGKLLWQLMTNKEVLWVRWDTAAKTQICPVAGIPTKNANKKQISTNEHPYNSWFKNMRDALTCWAAIRLPNMAVPEMLRWIKRRHWKQIKKEVAAAIIGAM
ncbi:PREDICTED: uncharacterized protein LOC109206689, partial [Nicotiana attenuata]|uniref:uncharacterized protein LOC109206689 n=1 Tax=Nicotiana attenuata TaxID=49451 RepID=UPI0009050C08